MNLSIRLKDLEFSRADHALIKKTPNLKRPLGIRGLARNVCETGTNLFTQYLVATAAKSTRHSITDLLGSQHLFR